jgi:hypothetical protein
MHGNASIAGPLLIVRSLTTEERAWLPANPRPSRLGNLTGFVLGSLACLGSCWDSAALVSFPTSKGMTNALSWIPQWQYKDAVWHVDRPGSDAIAARPALVARARVRIVGSKASTKLCVDLVSGLRSLLRILRFWSRASRTVTRGAMSSRINV